MGPSTAGWTPEVLLSSDVWKNMKPPGAPVQISRQRAIDLEAGLRPAAALTNLQDTLFLTVLKEVSEFLKEQEGERVDKLKELVKNSAEFFRLSNGRTLSIIQAEALNLQMSCREEALLAYGQKLDSQGKSQARSLPFTGKDIFGDNRNALTDALSVEAPSLLSI